MKRKTRWGIIGPGWISQKFTESLVCLEEVELAAVGSRSRERALEYAARYGFKRSYGSYEELADDPDIDIVYIATPHSSHYGNAMLCMEKGKAVICEKPLTINADQAERLIKKSRETGLFFMEAMWTRYLPAIVKIRELLKQGAIGEIKMVKADFGLRNEIKPERRLFNPELGGGALLDVGIYPVSFACMALGFRPATVTGVAHIGTTGVDEQFAALLGYEDGRIAVLAAAIRARLVNEALIIGSEGFVKVPEFWKARAFELNIGGKSELIKMPFRSTGYLYEAEEAMNCMREGQIESSIMPHEESLEIMRLMDSLRRQWNLKYPGE